MMKARGVKFQLLLWFMIILFGGYLGLSIYLAPNVSSGSISESQVEKAPDIDIDAQPEDIDPGDVEAGVEKDKIPTNPIQLINYALNLYNEGKGSLSYGTYVITNEGKLPSDMFPGLGGVKVEGTQFAIFKTVKNGTQNLEESYFYYDVEKILEGILVGNGLLRFGYRAINVDEAANTVTTVETNKTQINKNEINCANWKHDFNDSSARKRTFNNIDSALDTYKIIYSRDFPLEINEKNCIVKSNNTKKDPQYTFITLSFNVNKLPDSFKYYYKANGGLQDVTYTSYTYEFKISKKTGKLARIVRTEEFTSYALGGKVKIDSTASFVQTFYSMNKAQEVPQIYTEWTNK